MQNEDTKILALPGQILKGGLEEFDAFSNEDKELSSDKLAAHLVVICFIKKLDYMGVVNRLIESGRLDVGKSDLMKYFCDYSEMQTLVTTCISMSISPGIDWSIRGRMTRSAINMADSDDRWLSVGRKVIIDLIRAGMKLESEHILTAKKYYQAEDVAKFESEAIDFKINQVIGQKENMDLCGIRKNRTPSL